MRIKLQIIQKLNVIIELIKHCVIQVPSTQDQLLMQEVTLAVITHEGLCKLFEQDGPTEHVISLINEFGRAVANLYRNISATKLLPASFKINFQQDKNLLN